MQVRIVVDVRFQYSFKFIFAAVFVAAIGAAITAAAPWLWPEMICLTLTAAGFALVFSQKQPLLFYLRYVNPVVAVAVLAVCYYAATVDVDRSNGVYDFEYFGLFRENIASYFFAKGIFSATAIFLLGKILELLLHAAAARSESCEVPIA